MNDLKAMIRDELKQALAGVIPPPAMKMVLVPIAITHMLLIFHSLLMFHLLPFPLIIVMLLLELCLLWK